MRSGAVPVVKDDGADGLESALVVCAHGHDHHDERIFVCGRNANLGTCADEQRTDVHGSAGAVRWHVFDIGLDHLLGGLDEHLYGHRRHYGALCGAHHAARVLLRTEQHDLAILLAERLHSLEALLPVVKAACANVHRDGGILHELALTPLAVLPDVADVAVYVSETETETLPINVWHGFYYLSFNP